MAAGHRCWQSLLLGARCCMCLFRWLCLLITSNNVAVYQPLRLCNSPEAGRQPATSPDRAAAVPARDCLLLQHTSCWRVAAHLHLTILLRVAEWGLAANAAIERDDLIDLQLPSLRSATSTATLMFTTLLTQHYWTFVITCSRIALLVGQSDGWEQRCAVLQSGQNTVQL